jgi:ribosome-associated protein
MEFTLSSEYIELIKLLKLMGVAESGAQAKELVEEGEVLVNGEEELRKRRKLRSGDVVVCLDEEIRVIA